MDRSSCADAIRKFTRKLLSPLFCFMTSHVSPLLRGAACSEDVTTCPKKQTGSRRWTMESIAGMGEEGWTLDFSTAMVAQGGVGAWSELWTSSQVFIERGECPKLCSGWVPPLHRGGGRGGLYMSHLKPSHHPLSHINLPIHSYAWARHPSREESFVTVIFSPRSSVYWVVSPTVRKRTNGGFSLKG